MCNSIMLASMIYDEANGIAKKIWFQAAALSYNGDSAALFCFGKNGVLKMLFDNGVMTSRQELSCFGGEKKYSSQKIKMEFHKISMLLDLAKDEIKRKRPEIIYIRHMVPQKKLISFIRYARSRGIRIGYEIPTYPYFMEQINVSHNKTMAYVRVAYEMMYWPLIYTNIYRLFVMQCNSRVHMYRKMIPIKNGYSGVSHTYVKRETEDLHMIGVGTIYPYHGYDRIIKAMKKCNYILSSGGRVYFHIVGESEETKRLKSILNAEDQKFVIFHGIKTGEELADLYCKSNVGVGTMLLSLRHADIDTAIKNIEYLSYYIPVISSGRVFDFSENCGAVMKIEENEDIDFNSIASFAEKFYNDDSMPYRVDKLLCDFKWNRIMENVKKSLLG